MVALMLRFPWKNTSAAPVLSTALNVIIAFVLCPFTFLLVLNTPDTFATFSTVELDELIVPFAPLSVILTVCTLAELLDDELVI